MDLDKMRGLLAALLEMRFSGIRSSSYEGQSITYSSDAELQRAIRDLENRIAAAEPTARRSRIRRVYAVKDL